MIFLKTDEIILQKKYNGNRVLRGCAKDMRRNEKNDLAESVEPCQKGR